MTSGNCELVNLYNSFCGRDVQFYLFAYYTTPYITNAFQKGPFLGLHSTTSLTTGRNSYNFQILATLNNRWKRFMDDTDLSQALKQQ